MCFLMEERCNFGFNHYAAEFVRARQQLDPLRYTAERALPRSAARRRESRYASAISGSKLSEKATTSPRSGSGTLNVSRVTDKHRMNAA
jgi:hypothetical protein